MVDVEQLEDRADELAEKVQDAKLDLYEAKAEGRNLAIVTTLENRVVELERKHDRVLRQLAGYVDIQEA